MTDDMRDLPSLQTLSVHISPLWLLQMPSHADYSQRKLSRHVCVEAMMTYEGAMASHMTWHAKF